MPEILRIIKALQMADCSNGATPANWKPGEPIINPAPKTFSELEERAKLVKENNNGMSWYLSFKEPNEECNICNK